MRNFTITELEWHNVLDKLQVIEKENEKLKGIIEGMNKTLSLYNVVRQSEQLLDFIQWRKQVAVDDLTEKEIVEFYLSRKIK